MSLNKLSKRQLIKLVEELTMEQGITEDELAVLEEEALNNEAFMESHGRIDYGYGVGIYGPL